MSYFSNLPNIYVGQDDDTGISYRLVKNIFRRVIIQEKLDIYGTEFEAFTIRDGMRPETVASLFLGDPFLDWIILLTNNITDVYEDWPRNDYELLSYCQSKYENIEDVHHWETNEIKWNNLTIIKQGIQVNEEWRPILPDKTSRSKEESIYPVSNFEYETQKNEKKRLIAVPNQRLVDFFEEEFRELVDYLPNSELDDEGNKKTILSLVGRYLDSVTYRRSSSPTITGTVAGTSSSVSVS